jgi:hypothetical protein
MENYGYCEVKRGLNIENGKKKLKWKKWTKYADFGKKTDKGKKCV